MNQKKGAAPLILLLILCLLLSVWVWKHVPAEGAAGLQPERYDLNRLLAQEKPVLLNISSDDCPYCVMMEPDLEQIYRQYGNVAVVCDINVDRFPQISMDLPVRATPTQVLFYADGTPYVPSETAAGQMQFLYYVQEGSNTHVLTVHEGMMTASQMEQILQEMGAAQ